MPARRRCRRSPPPGYGPQRAGARARQCAPTTRRRTLARDVLGDTEDVWGAVFKTMGAHLRAAAARAVSGRVAVGVRVASRRGGAVLLPGRSQALSRHRVLRRACAAVRGARRFRAGVRDRARGRSPRAEPDRHDAASSTRHEQRTDERGRNALSVRLELQADCYAGVWGYFAQKRNMLEPGDLEEGLRGGRRRRRRSHPEAGAGLRRARFVHARHRRAARSTGSRPGSRAATCASATRSTSASPDRGGFPPSTRTLRTSRRPAPAARPRCGRSGSHRRSAAN